MKKKMFLLTFIFMFALTLSFSTSALETPFYSMEINDEFYALEENTDTASVWSNAYGSSISINITSSSGADFSSISASEIDILTKQVKSTYENLNLDSVENVKGFKGNFCSVNSFNYTLDFSYDGSEYSVEGFIFPSGKYLYTIETSSYSQKDRKIINDMLNSFRLPNTVTYDETDIVLSNDGEEIEFVSKDGVFSFDIPSGFAEQVGVPPIEKQWTKNDASLAIAFFTLENTSKLSMVGGLSKNELEAFVSSMVGSVGADIDDAVAENVTVNGYDGIKVNTAIKTLGLTADTDIYAFSTEDTVAFICFYRYAETDERVIDDILESLSIGEELLAKSGTNYIFIGTIAGMVIGGIIALVVSKKRKKPSFNADANAQFSGYTQV